MSFTLHGLLEQDDPVALRRIEKALLAGDVRNETVNTVLSALMWRRCTKGQIGVLGALIDHECAAQISVLAQNLDLVGASDAAQAIRDLRRNISLEDEQIRRGIIDWIDVNPRLIKHAETLNDKVFDVAPKVWTFMQQRQSELPDAEIPDKPASLFARLFGEQFKIARWQA